MPRYCVVDRRLILPYIPIIDRLTSTKRVKRNHALMSLRKFNSTAILVLVVISVAILPSATVEASCVTEWSTCRSDATAAYFRDEIGTFRYSLLLDGCDIGYGACVMIRQ